MLYSSKYFGFFGLDVWHIGIRSRGKILAQRPSIYQSGCNFSCRKCHARHFGQKAMWKWNTFDKLLEICRDYEKEVAFIEPRSKATAWHAGETCQCCGRCVTTGNWSGVCTGVLTAGQITLSPQGYGPVRNIAAFTVGDLTCRFIS